VCPPRVPSVTSDALPYYESSIFPFMPGQSE